MWICYIFASIYGEVKKYISYNIPFVSMPLVVRVYYRSLGRQ